MISPHRSRAALPELDAGTLASSPSATSDMLTSTVTDAASLLPNAVWRAAALGDEEAVEAWLNGGGAVDAREPSLNRTLLMAACEQGQEPIVEILLERGADINRVHEAGGKTSPLPITPSPPLTSSPSPSQVQL